MSDLQQLSMFDNLESNEASIDRSATISKLQTLAMYKERLFYSPKEAAELLGLSYFQVFMAIRMYRLDAVRVGCMWRIPWTAMIRFIEEEEFRNDISRYYNEWLKARGGA